MKSKGRLELRPGLTNHIVRKEVAYLPRIPPSLVFLLDPPAPPDSLPTHPYLDSLIHRLTDTHTHP